MPLPVVLGSAASPWTVARLRGSRPRCDAPVYHRPHLMPAHIWPRYHLRCIEPELLMRYTPSSMTEIVWTMCMLIN